MNILFLPASLPGNLKRIPSPSQSFGVSFAHPRPRTMDRWPCVVALCSSQKVRFRFPEIRQRSPRCPRMPLGGWKMQSRTSPRCNIAAWEIDRGLAQLYCISGSSKSAKNAGCDGARIYLGEQSRNPSCTIVIGQLLSYRPNLKSQNT